VILLGEENWYGNKELFEMIQGLKEDLQETRTAVQRYNGLRRDLANVMQRLTIMEQKKLGQTETFEGIRKWGGWIIAIITLVLYLYQLGVI
jgi:hypothetical protein